MDTFGPTRTRSIQGYYHNTSFTCDHSGYVFSYGHANMSQIPEITAQFYADTARIHERHGDAPFMSVFFVVTMPLSMSL